MSQRSSVFIACVWILCDSMLKQGTLPWNGSSGWKLYPSFRELTLNHTSYTKTCWQACHPLPKYLVSLLSCQFFTLSYPYPTILSIPEASTINIQDSMWKAFNSKLMFPTNKHDSLQTKHPYNNLHVRLGQSESLTHLLRRWEKCMWCFSNIFAPDPRSQSLVECCILDFQQFSCTLGRTLIFW